jgi:hypothetical protein
MRKDVRIVFSEPIPQWLMSMHLLTPRIADVDGRSYEPLSKPLLFLHSTKYPTGLESYTYFGYVLGCPLCPENAIARNDVRASSLIVLSQGSLETE